MTLTYCQDDLTSYYECWLDVINDVEYPWRLIIDSTDGIPPYQLARYDGNLEGSEVGYTFFYTDLVAKAWLTVDRGTGNPSYLGMGFVPMPDADVPESLCTTGSISGRLWFDLGQERISVLDSEVNLGSIVTRVFTKMDDPTAPLTSLRDGLNEIDSNYELGRGIWWWDRHYLLIADYEPQYQRLDQLMRWSTVIAWLVNQNLSLLPEVAISQSSRTFGEWLENRYELRWKFDIPFVQIPGENSETLLRLYAKYDVNNCGASGRWSGGVTGPRLKVINALSAPRPLLPKEILRSNIARQLTNNVFNAKAKTVLKTLNDVNLTLEPLASNSALIQISAPGSNVWRVGGIKLSKYGTVRRNFAMNTEVNTGLIKTKVQVEDSLLAEVSIKTQGTRVQVQVKPGAFSQVRPVLEAFQENLFYSGSTLDDVAELASVTPGVHIVYKDPKYNRVYLQVDNGSSSPQWLAIRKGKEGFDGADFYLKQLDDTVPDGLGWYNGRLSSAPELQANGDWVKIVRNADDAALKLESVSALPTNPRQFTVHFADEGRTSQVIVGGDNILLQATDPILNESQLVSRNFLYDSSKVKQISSLQRGSLILDDGSVLLIQGEQKLFLSKNFLDELATTSRPLEPYGHIKIGAPVDLANQQKIYALTIGDDVPVVVQVANASDDIMAAPYPKDMSKPLSSGNQSITIITGRSASIRIRQSQVMQASEPGTTFAYLYELDEGGRLGIQIGPKSVELNVSWETLLDDLNQHKVPQPLVSAMKEVDGQIILVADSKLDKAIRMSDPTYVAAVDQPTLVTVLDDQLDARVFSADDIAVAKANLGRLAPMDIDNTAIVIDTPSLTPKQAPLIESMVETIRTSDIPFDESQIFRSMDKLPDAQNIILITAENDAQLAAKLALKGEAGELRDKFVLVAACGNESVCSFVTSGSVKQYGATGFGVFRDQIYAETLPQFVPEILRVAKANPGLQPDQVITTAVKQLQLNFQQKQPTLMEWLKTSGINTDVFREGIERLRNIFFQMSYKPEAYL